MRGGVQCAVLLWAMTTAAAVAAPAQDDEATARTVSAMVAASLSDHAELDVLSSEDVRRVVAVEADRQMLGCADDAKASCLAEVAGAMDASVVVFGDLGHLGSVLVVTLNVFDSAQGTSGGRVIVKAASLEELAEKLGPAVDKIAAGVPKPAVAGQRVRVIVLDVRPPPVSAAPVTAGDDAPFPWLLASGGATAGVGVLVVGVGAVLGAAALVAHQTAESPDTNQIDADQAYQARDDRAWLANVAFVGGAVLVVVGGGVAALALLGGE
jgi:hypothetical protein